MASSVSDRLILFCLLFCSYWSPCKSCFLSHIVILSSHDFTHKRTVWKQIESGFTFGKQLKIQEAWLQSVLYHGAVCITEICIALVNHLIIHWGCYVALNELPGFCFVICRHVTSQVMTRTMKSGWLTLHKEWRREKVVSWGWKRFSGD